MNYLLYNYKDPSLIPQHPCKTRGDSVSVTPVPLQQAGESLDTCRWASLNFTLKNKKGLERCLSGKDGQLAQWLRALLAASVKDPILVSDTQVGQITTTLISNSWASDTLFWPLLDKQEHWVLWHALLKQACLHEFQASPSYVASWFE